MFDLLGRFHHLPRRAEGGFVALFLPEFEIEFPAWKSALDKPRLPLRSRFNRFILHGTSSMTSRSARKRTNPKVKVVDRTVTRAELARTVPVGQLGPPQAAYIPGGFMPDT